MRPAKKSRRYGGTTGSPVTAVSKSRRTINKNIGKTRKCMRSESLSAGMYWGPFGLCGICLDRQDWAGEAGMPVHFLVYVTVVVLLWCIGFCVPRSGRTEIQENAKRRAVIQPGGDGM